MVKETYNYTPLKQTEDVLPSGLIAEYGRLEGLQVIQPALLLRLNPENTNPITEKNFPPRRRALIISIGERVAIGYHENDQPQGYHSALLEEEMLRYLGEDKVRFLLHGHVETLPDDSPVGKKGVRVVKIFKIPPEDLQSTPIVTGYKKGRLFPEKFVTGLTAQKILFALEAQRLFIVEADRSLHTYESLNQKIRGFVLPERQKVTV